MKLPGSLWAEIVRQLCFTIFCARLFLNISSFFFFFALKPCRGFYQSFLASPSPSLSLISIPFGCFPLVLHSPCDTLLSGLAAAVLQLYHQAFPWRRKWVMFATPPGCSPFALPYCHYCKTQQRQQSTCYLISYLKRYISALARQMDVTSSPASSRISARPDAFYRANLGSVNDFERVLKHKLVVYGEKDTLAWQPS